MLTYFMGKILTAIISMAIIPLFINWFGEDNYGVYIITYVTFLIFISGFTGWINQSVIKFHDDFENKELFYKKVNRINLSAALLAIIPLLSTVYVNIDTPSFFLFFVITLGFITGCMYTSKLIQIQTELESLKYSIAEIIRLFSFLLLVFIVKFFPFLNVLEVLFFSLFMSYFFSYLFLNKRTLLIDFKIDFKLTKKFLNYGLPLSIWMVFSPSANGIDKYILNHFLGASILAQYAAMYDIVFKVFTQLVNPINSVYQPLLMKINSTGNKELFNKTLKRGLLFLFLVCVPVLFIFYFFRDFIITDFLGFTNLDTIRVLKKTVMPLGISAIIWQIAIILQKKLEALGKTKLIAGYIVIVVSIGALISILLLPKYNFTILAYINLFGSIVYLLLIFLSNKFLN